MAGAAALVSAITAVHVGAPVAGAVADPIVFADGFGTTWSDWSWWATTETASASPVASGSRALAATITQSYGALSVRTSDPVVTTSATQLRLALHGGASGVSLNLFVGQDEGNASISPLVQISAPANTWAPITVTMAQLGNPARIARINFNGANGSTTARFSVDDLSVTNGVTPTTTLPPTSSPPTTAPTTTLPSTAGSITIDATSAGSPFSPRMWGSNINMYQGPWGLANATVRARSSGKVGLIRYPGGQDSQKWGWASCQTGTEIPNAAACGPLSWVAKPSDFIAFARSISAEPIITVNINATAKENAAFVAFMNGAVGDTRVIGVDQRGVDWRTVGYWAQLRSSNGSPAPLGVKLWEYGNETYGGLPGGNKCVSYGWEVVFSCDAAEYLNGVGTGAAHKNGYREAKAAMQAIDAGIQLGAPSMHKLADYNNWTNELLANGGNVIDFLVVHPYFTWIPPADTAAGNAELLALPQKHWSDMRAELDRGFAQYTGGRRIPMLISEYNLTPGTPNDPARRTNLMANALILSDSVGAMASLPGFIGANQFELFGSAQSDGTFFGLLRNDATVSRAPAYYGWALWSRFGATLLPSSSTFDPASQLSVYAGRKSANSLTLYVINKSATVTSATIRATGAGAFSSVTQDVAGGGSFYDYTVPFNGNTNPSDDLSNAPGSTRSLGGAGAFAQSFAPYSLTLLTIITGSAPPTTAPPTTAPPTTAPPTTAPPTLPPTTQPGGTCRVTYSVAWDGGTSFGGDVTVTNTGAALNGWNLRWSFAGNQRIDLLWGGAYTQSGAAVSVTDAGWNASLPTNGSASFGFRALYSGANAKPTSVQLNGVTCTVV